MGILVTFMVIVYLNKLLALRMGQIIQISIFVLFPFELLY